MKILDKTRWLCSKSPVLPYSFIFMLKDYGRKNFGDKVIWYIHEIYTIVYT